MNRTTFEPGPLAQVKCHGTDDRWTLVFVRDLRHPPDKVWTALTDPDQLREWTPYTADRDLSRVGEATLTMIDDDSSDDLPASVLHAEAPTLLEYTWGTDVLRWELAAVGSGTRLTLRHTIDDREWVPKVAAGWHICLVVAERLLDGRPVPSAARTPRSTGGTRCTTPTPRSWRCPERWPNTRPRFDWSNGWREPLPSAVRSRRLRGKRQ